MYLAQYIVIVAVLSGTVTYYGTGVMEQVYEKRIGWQEVEPCHNCIGMVALLDKKHIGTKVWLQRPGNEPEGPFLVVDCAREQDIPELTRRNIVVEVDRATAHRWQMRGPLPDIKVVFQYTVTRARDPIYLFYD